MKNLSVNSLKCKTFANESRKVQNFHTVFTHSGLVWNSPINYTKNIEVSFNRNDGELIAKMTLYRLFNRDTFSERKKFFNLPLVGNVKFCMDFYIKFDIAYKSNNVISDVIIPRLIIMKCYDW